MRPGQRTNVIVSRESRAITFAGIGEAIFAFYQRTKKPRYSGGAGGRLTRLRKVRANP
jgi:hypothetical protein